MSIELSLVGANSLQLLQPLLGQDCLQVGQLIVLQREREVEKETTVSTQDVGTFSGPYTEPSCGCMVET